MNYSFAQRNYILSTRENQVKKQWLIATILTLILYPLVGYGILQLFGPGLTPSGEIFYTLAATALIGIFSFWIIWHCAYKKCGTKLLTFWLITTIPKLLAILGRAIFVDNLDMVGWAVTLGSVAGSIWWCFASIALRKLNQQISSLSKSLA